MQKEFGYQYDCIDYIKEQLTQGNITKQDMILIVYYPYKSKFVGMIIPKTTNINDVIKLELEDINNNHDIYHKNKGFIIYQEMGFDIDDMVARECRELLFEGNNNIDQYTIRQSFINNLINTDDIDTVIEYIDDTIHVFNTNK